MSIVGRNVLSLNLLKIKMLNLQPEDYLMFKLSGWLGILEVVLLWLYSHIGEILIHNYEAVLEM